MLVLLLWLFEPIFSVGAVLTAEPLATFHWTHTTVLDPDGSFHLFWLPEEEWVTFEIQAKTTGYVGLGFSPHGKMAGADIVMSWVKNGEVHLYDYHSVGNQLPMPDEHQDYHLLRGYENETHTVVRFRRKWITCDKDDNDLLVDTMHVLWSLGTGNQQERDNILIKHEKRGSKCLYLKDPQDHQLPTLTDTKLWEVRAPNVTIPDMIDTYYYCRTFKAPETDTKHHIIGFFPVISPGNVKHVHHMILYRCRDDISLTVFNRYTETGYPCYLEEREEMGKCETIFIGWATGSTGTNFPEMLGFPLGSRYGGSDYFVLEIHYDNTDREKGVLDSSGLDVYYTDKLRENDGDTLTIGHTFEAYQLVPPGQTKFTTTGICGSKCTQEALPEGGIKVISGLLHSHLAGRKMRIRHIRNGQELPNILKDDHYDFNYQETRLLNKVVTVLPGDELIMECVYATENRNNMIIGGFGTEDEMCAAFLFYYPRLNVSTCNSRPSNETFFSAFIGSFPELLQLLSSTNEENENTNTRERREELSTSKEVFQDVARIIRNRFFETKTAINVGLNINLRYLDIIRSVDWSNKEAVDLFQKTITYGPYMQSCRPPLYDKTKMKPYMDEYPQFSPLPDVDTSVCPAAPQVMEEVNRTVLEIPESELLEPRTSKPGPSEPEILETGIPERKVLDLKIATPQISGIQNTGARNTETISAANNEARNVGDEKYQSEIIRTKISEQGISDPEILEAKISKPEISEERLFIFSYKIPVT